jgi:hypothetical protein
MLRALFSFYEPGKGLEARNSPSAKPSPSRSSINNVRLPWPKLKRGIVKFGYKPIS